MSEFSLIVALSALAGALALDTTAALQSMLSQPLVAGAIAGALAGDVALGLVIGTALQLVWLGSLPVGAAPFPDGAVAGVAGAGAAVLAARSGAGAGPATAVGVFLGLGAGAAGQWVTTAVRRLNVRYSDLAAARAERGDAGGVRAAVALGLLTRFATGAALGAAALTVAALLSGSLARARVEGSFATVLWAAPIAAAAVVVGSKGVLEKYLLAAGVAVGLLVAVSL